MNGMKIKAKLKEMKDAEAHFVSLVTRSANRIPFRIQKFDKEQSMIDLTSIGRVLKRESAARKPEVTGVVVEKSDGAKFEAIKKALTDHGLSVDNVIENEDGTVTFAQKAECDKGATMVRMSGNSVALVQNLGDLPQVPVLKADGFVHGPISATEVVQMLVAKQDFDAVAQASEYAKAVAAQVPEVAVKVDAAITEVVKGSQGGTMNQAAIEDVNKERTPSGGEGGAAAVGANPAGNSTGSINDEGDIKAPKGFDGSVWEGMTKEQKLAILGWNSQSAKKADCDNDEDAKKKNKELDKESHVAAPAAPNAAVEEVVAKALAPITESIKNLSQSLEAVIKTQKAVGEQVAAISEKSQQVEKAVKGTVINTPLGGDQPAGGEAVRKQDNDPRTGCFDTAFLRK